MKQFNGMTCFKITHHKSTEGLWSFNPNFKYKQHGAKDTRMKDEKRAYSIVNSHPIYLRLRCKYGLDPKKRKKDEHISGGEEGSDIE
jgi:hypothetical protein